MLLFETDFGIEERREREGGIGEGKEEEGGEEGRMMKLNAEKLSLLILSSDLP